LVDSLPYWKGPKKKWSFTREVSGYSEGEKANANFFVGIAGTPEEGWVWGMVSAVSELKCWKVGQGGDLNSGERGEENRSRLEKDGMWEGKGGKD